jgi:hypothetical protein
MFTNVNRQYSLCILKLVSHRVGDLGVPLKCLHTVCYLNKVLLPIPIIFNCFAYL